ncbi:hypothetical protein MASR2M47_07220 [Draconibacterium sp.]|jgi:hypothetical protein
MKIRKLNLVTLFQLLFPFCVVILGAGCEKEEDRDPLCYQGMVVSLNQGDGCSNIIRIIKSTKGGALEAGNTISFNPDLYGVTLKDGDVVYFKVIEYEEFGDIISTQPCAFPQFAALIEFCNN